MDKFFVYSGKINSDNYEGMTHDISAFNSESEVLEFYQEFLAELTEDDTEIKFQVIKGVELKLTPVEKITTYKLSPS